MFSMSDWVVRVEVAVCGRLGCLGGGLISADVGRRCSLLAVVCLLYNLSGGEVKSFMKEYKIFDEGAVKCLMKEYSESSSFGITCV